MKQAKENPPYKNPGLPAEDYHSRLSKLQKREWSLWGTSLVIIFFLTVGLTSLSFAAALRDRNVLESVVGLTILVALFGCYSTYEKFLINRLRNEIAQNQANSELWREIALVDSLTGLANRRYAERRLKEEILRSQRRGYPLTLVLFDLNSFKEINDRFGHDAGDMVLKLFAKSLRGLGRETDVAARLGGDEFSLLLTECDKDEAQSIIARFNPGQANLAGHQVPICFAFGCSQYQLGNQPHDLLRAADEALYEHKRKSKSANLAPAK